MYQIQKFFFRNDLSNPIATDLGGEIDVHVSFIIATLYFSFDIFLSNCPFIMSADHKTSPILVYLIICCYENPSRKPLILPSILTVDHK